MSTVIAASNKTKGKKKNPQSDDFQVNEEDPTFNAMKESLSKAETENEEPQEEQSTAETSSTKRKAEDEAEDGEESLKEQQNSTSGGDVILIQVPKKNASALQRVTKKLKHNLKQQVEVNLYVVRLYDQEAEPDHPPLHNPDAPNYEPINLAPHGIVVIAISGDGIAMSKIIREFIKGGRAWVIGEMETGDMDTVHINKNFHPVYFNPERFNYLNDPFLKFLKWDFPLWFVCVGATKLYPSKRYSQEMLEEDPQIVMNQILNVFTNHIHGSEGHDMMGSPLINVKVQQKFITEQEFEDYDPSNTVVKLQQQSTSFSEQNNNNSGRKFKTKFLISTTFNSPSTVGGNGVSSSFNSPSYSSSSSRDAI